MRSRSAVGSAFRSISAISPANTGTACFRTSCPNTPPAARFACTAQTRYRQPDEACEVIVRDDGRVELRFARPQRAVTPGQSLVLYDGDVCLGGAVTLHTDAPVVGHELTRNDAA